MLKPQFLDAQRKKSKRLSLTSPFLRRLISSLVADALFEFYGGTVSMRCLQSSIAVKRLLDIYGIKSKNFIGDICLLEASEDGSLCTWGGFWKDHYHVWTITEYGERVDLTVAELHNHPASSRSCWAKLPSIWWDNIQESVAPLIYLEDAPVDPGIGSYELKEELAEFLELVDQKHFDALKSKTADQIISIDQVSKSSDLRQLEIDGHPWAKAAGRFLEIGLPPLPEWIISRQAAIKTAHMQGKPRPSIRANLRQFRRTG
ncbi:hypothetical protein [Aquidulcibacter paucihalophilus]|uniref:hypothetical protein n=1 Tax=Aquidulcibacter paucihalophilus TaxID=1978549 RepID=UPI000A1993A2|nr:hypothetical protein [Aquidulcibacter paucihalophilus]